MRKDKDELEKGLKDNNLTHIEESYYYLHYAAPEEKQKWKERKMQQVRHNKKQEQKEENENKTLSCFSFDPPTAKSCFFENDNINNFDDFAMAKWCGYIG